MKCLLCGSDEHLARIINLDSKVFALQRGHKVKDSDNAYYEDAWRAEVKEKDQCIDELKDLLRRWKNSAKDVLFDSRGQELRRETGDVLEVVKNE